MALGYDIPNENWQLSLLKIENLYVLEFSGTNKERVIYAQYR